MGKKKRRNIGQQQQNEYAEPTESEARIHPDATLSPTEPHSNSTTIDLLQKESTNAPVIGEKDHEEGYVQSWPGLIDKHLLGKRPIPFSIILIASVIAAGIIFVQDNGAGLLTNFKSISWTIIKSGIAFLIILIVWFVLSAILWIQKKFEK